MVKLMGSIYGDILRVIEERDYDVFSGRASVPGSRKVALATAILVRPTAGLPAQKQLEVAMPLLPRGVSS